MFDSAAYLAIVMLARCGMRINEPLHLYRHHYRADDGTVYIERTKFRKDRLIPVPKDVLGQIENYLAHLRLTGQVDSEGSFTVSGLRAVGKLAVFLLVIRSILVVERSGILERLILVKHSCNALVISACNSMYSFGLVNS